MKSGVGAVVLAAIMVGPVAILAADEGPCADELAVVPASGDEVAIAQPWLSVSGHLGLAGLHRAEDEEVSLRRDGEAIDGVRWETMEGVKSHLGVALPELEPGGSYEWFIGDRAMGQFDVSDAPEEAGEPRFGEGEVEVEIELINYDEFPVLYREWHLRFPGVIDESMEGNAGRYVVDFVNRDTKESAKIFVSAEAGDDGWVEVSLGGPSEKCQHVEPEVGITDEIEIEIRAVGLDGQLIEEGVQGVFEGVSEERLAAAHEEFRGVIDGLDVDEDAMTTEEMAQQMEAEESGGDGDGCAAAGSATAPLWSLLALLGLVAWGRRHQMS